jgi:hypothetical protein
MVASAVAKTIAEIAEHERVRAVRSGDYVWAIVCALVEEQALLYGGGNG